MAKSFDIVSNRLITFVSTLVISAANFGFLKIDGLCSHNFSFQSLISENPS